MVNFKKLSSQANRVKDLIDKQGGSDAVKDKAQRVKNIAVGQGTMSEKAKAAAEVAKERPPEGAEGAQGSATEGKGSTDSPKQN